MGLPLDGDRNDGICSDDLGRGGGDPRGPKELFRTAALGFIDCARIGETRAVGENGDIAETLPESFLSKAESEIEHRGGRIPP